jgi:hypothetical protein
MPLVLVQRPECALVLAEEPTVAMLSLRLSIEARTVDLFIANLREGKPRRRLRLAARPAAAKVRGPRVLLRWLQEILEVGRGNDPPHGGLGGVDYRGGD